MHFAAFKTAVAAQFETLRKHDLFRTTVGGDALWDTYLASFPPGTNPVFRQRSEHDCSCCRQFIRAVGNTVAIIDGQLVSLWDITVPNEPAYQAVADAMSQLVKTEAVSNLFLHGERSAGTDKSFEQMLDHVQTWNHFHVNIPDKFYCKNADQGPKLSDAQARHDVLHRSLREISEDALETVLELIAQNSLYRGQEYKATLTKFQALKKKFAKLGNYDPDLYVWSLIGSTPGPVAKIRGTAIGTLLIDLSEGLELEQAVRKFEAVVAPSNYKRPTALVTKKMVEDAKAKLEELGLTSALERRYARLSDISINNVLFADRGARRVLKGDVFDSLPTKTTSRRNLDRVEEIGIEKFISDIVPRAESIEAMVEGRHTSNLVSLIAPVDPTANRLFKWDNNFSWTYNGDVADSLKERVKRAGGSVAGDLCCRLAWYNYDDLDLHMVEPPRYEIYFGNRQQVSPGGGMLDVDMNAGGGQTREAVENIYYAKRQTMAEGDYHLFVQNFAKREAIDVGFEVEIDFLGTVRRFAYPKALRSGENVTVAKFKYSHAKGVEFIESLPSTQASKTVWNVTTEEFHKVNVLLRSPNYWDNSEQAGDSGRPQGIGNEHYFFMLDGCQNDGTARGFYNEFLKQELTPHRKVIEMVGAKMRTEESVNQLSGLGFSSTQRQELLVRVKGSFTRNVKVVF
jgi:hypothetical protein